MPLIPDEFLAELNRRTDIAELIGNYVDLKGRGNRMVGLCPFHNEKTGSFTVFTDTNSYYCFGCGAGGSPVTFVRQIENLDFFEAVKMLADKAGLVMPQDGYDNSYANLKKRIYEINRQTAYFYNKYLYSENGKAVYDYFKGRGLTDATIKHFGLGASPNKWDGLLKHLKSKGYREDEMLQANVVVRGKNGSVYDRFIDRAMFPIIDLRGNVIAFGGRKLPSDQKQSAKYINTSDTPVFKKSQNLYAFNFAKASCSNRIILAEGYMDVIALHQAGITNAVAALGTAFTEEHASIISRYTKEIVLTLDSDEAGQKATERALKILSNTGLPVRVLNIPDGKDPDEFIKKHGENGANAFKDLLNASINSIEYKLLEAAKGTNISTDNGKLEYTKKCIALLASLNDDVAADLYSSKLSQKLGISKEAILNQIKIKRAQNHKKQTKIAQKEIITPKYNIKDVNSDAAKMPRAAAAEETIISILIFSPDLLSVVNQKLDQENFLTSFNRRVFVRLKQVIEEGISFDVSLLGNDFTPEECGRIAKYQNRLSKGENAKDELIDSINVLLSENAKAKINSKDISIDEWAEQLKNFAKNKK